MAAIGLALVVWKPHYGPGWLLVNSAWFEVSMILSLLPHEFAHAFAARALGMRVFRVILGFGPAWWRGSLFGFDVEARAFPFEGVVVAAHREPRGTNWKGFIFILAGPMANALMLGLAAMSPASHPGWETFVTGWAALPGFALANLSLLITNLWPHQIKTVLGIFPSDGRYLLLALLGRGGKTPEERHATWFLLEAQTCLEQQKPDEARAWIDRGLTSYPENSALLSHRSLLLMNAGELAAAREISVALLGRPSVTQEMRLILMNNIAYASAVLGTDLDEADRYSAEATAAFPWHPALQNTRGTVLFALGRLDEALPILRKNAGGTQRRPEHIAQTLSILAMAEAQSGQILAAERAIATARLADPNCFLLSRAEAAVRASREKVGTSSAPVPE